MNQPPFAEYPRPGYEPRLGRGPGVYFDAIGEGWDLVRQDLGHWVVATIVYFVATYALTLPVSLITRSMMPTRLRPDQIFDVFPVLGLQTALNLIPTAIVGVLHAGTIAMGVRKARGETINVGMIFEPFRKFGTVLGASLLYYVICFAGFLLCGIPTLYFAPVLILMPVVAYLKGVGTLESLSLTFDACKRHWLGLFGLLLVMGLVTFAGFCACFVGILFAWPLYCMVLAIHYRAFFESSAPPQPVVPGL